MDETLGPMLTRLRTDQGRSQLRLAELLCALSGNATVSRHEVSRWEREQRIPARYWLGWLAVALEAELAELERAAARTRRLRPAEPVPRHTAVTRARLKHLLVQLGVGGDEPPNAISG